MNGKLNGRASRSKTRLAMTSVVTLLLCDVLLPLRAAATCFQPCGAPRSGNETLPVSTDALWVLKAAVGTVTTCVPCECKVGGGDGRPAASDALIILRCAVGLSCALSCPQCTPVVPAIAVLRGREDLELHDVGRADKEFACALETDPGHAEASFFRALTRLAHLVETDDSIDQLFRSAGGVGILDIYDFTAEFPDGADYPTVAELSPVVFGVLDDELQAALANLETATRDTAFTTHLTPRMVPAKIATTAEDTEIDAADAFVLSALLHVLRGDMFIAFKAYSPETVDDPLADTSAVFDHDCGERFLAQHPGFFVPRAADAFSTAEAEYESAIDDLILAIDSMRAEVDPQDDDFLVEDDIGNATENARALLVAARESLNGPADGLDTCRRALGRVELERLFDSPLGRDELPVMKRDAFDGACSVAEFPDPRFKGVLPDMASSDALIELGREPSVCLAALCPSCCEPCINDSQCDGMVDETGCFECSEDCAPGSNGRCVPFDKSVRCEDGIY